MFYSIWEDYFGKRFGTISLHFLSLHFGLPNFRALGTIKLVSVLFRLFRLLGKSKSSRDICQNTLTCFQGALKGTNLRGQTEPKRRFSQIFADSRRFLENEAFGKSRFSQETADFRRKPQKTAGTRSKPQIGVCPLRFVPLSAALCLLYFVVLGPKSGSTLSMSKVGQQSRFGPKTCTLSGFKRQFVSGQKKGPAERGHVKRRQEGVKHIFQHFSTCFTQGKKRQKSSKIVFDNFRAASVFGPF